ncbi:glycoside hydrolase family 16 protein [Bradyrhizobium sp. RDM12]
MKQCRVWALLCLTSLIASLASPAAASGWKLVFGDEFDSSQLDRTKWATRYIYSGETTDHLNDEVQRYKDNQNHIVRDGELQLVAREMGPNNFESGMIRSKQTFYYGYFETRVLFPKGRGIWPAFWLNPDYDEEGRLAWPPEIDIFEYVVNGKEDLETMLHSAASTTPNAPPITYSYRDPNYDTRWMSYVNSTPLNDDWHVFGLVWTPENISMFVDGKRIYTRPYQWLKRDGTLGAPAHVLLNFAVGGHWAGRHGIDQSQFPQAFRVDYVRVCQFTSDASGKPECGGSRFTPNPAEFGYRAEQNDLPKPILGPKTLVVQSTGSSKDPIKRLDITETTIAIDTHLRLPNSWLNAGRKLALSLRAPQTNKEFSRITLPLDTTTLDASSKEQLKIPRSLPGGLTRFRRLS